MRVAPPGSFPPGLRSARLRLRPWREADRAAIDAINRDPEVLRYLNAESDDAYIDRAAAHWTTHGFGHYAVESRMPGTAGGLLGFVGLAYPDFLPEVADRPELGWRLAPSAWGQGYATEAAAVLCEGLRRMRFTSYISIIHPENARSRRVAEKLGMQVERSVVHPAGERVDVWVPGEGLQNGPAMRELSA